MFNKNKNLLLVSSNPFITISLDELNKIIELYKDLTINDLVEHELVVDLGLNKDLIKNLFKELNITKSSGLFSSFQFIKSNKEEDYIKELEETISKLEIELKNKNNKLKEVENDIRSTTGFLKRCFSALNSTNEPVYASLFSNENLTPLGHSTVFLSDLHIGAYYKGDKLNLGSGYSLDIFESRFGYLVESLLDCSYMFYGSDTIEVCILGDIVESLLGNLRSSHGLIVDVYGEDVVGYVVSKLVSLLKNLHLQYPDKPITLSYVGGNHDRATRDKAEDKNRFIIPIIIKMVKLECGFPLTTENKTNKRWFGRNVTPSIRQIVNHGDNRLDPKNVFMLDAIHPAQYRVFVEGHLHTKQLKEYNNLLHLVAPSIMGSTEHSEMDMALASKPCQLVVKYQDENQKIKPYYIDL